MKIKNFSKAKSFKFFPNLLTVQKEAWQRFWETELTELFSEVFPIRDYTQEKLELQFLDFELGDSKYESGLEAKDSHASYEAAFKIKFKLVNLKTKETKEQEVLLCNFPLMTQKGTFILNGIERVAISQLIRSPGVFFTSRRIRGKEYFGAKIIPNRGAWLEIETDPTGFIGVKIDRRRKVAVTTLLKALLPFSFFAKEETSKINKEYKEYIQKKKLPKAFLKNHSLQLFKIYTQGIENFGPGFQSSYYDFTEKGDKKTLALEYRVKIQTEWNNLIAEIVKVIPREKVEALKLRDSLFKTLKFYVAAKEIIISLDDKIEEIFQKIDIGQVPYIKETLKRDSTHSQGEALVEICNRLRPGEMAAPETARELINNMFFNFTRYDLSKVGRWKTWQRLPETQNVAGSSEERDSPKGSISKSGGGNKIPLEDRILKIEDIIAAIKEIIRLNNVPGSKPDEIDHLGNRRVRLFTELLLSRMRVGLMRTERIIKNKMASYDIDGLTPSQLINPRPFMAQVQGFFISGQLSQFMDNENPLAELEHKRRLAATGPGGLAKERAGFEARDVQPSHYGRICPISTPEGPNVGLINYLAAFAKVNPFGFVVTPYFKVKGGKVLDEFKYLTAYEEEKYVIASGLVLVDSNNKILSKNVIARIKGVPGVAAREKIEFIDVSPQQCLSVATSCIPFLEHNDANRALMGSNMQRQAVPIIRPEPPFVITGMEEKVAMDSGGLIIADESGTIKEVDGSHIILETKGKPNAKVKNAKSKNKDIIYELNPFLQTNKDTCFHQKPIVQKGQKVMKGDILAEGGSIADGKLALGRNILVAFMPWRGANFEDAIIISDKVLKQDTLSSVHIKSYSTNVRETKLGPEITTWDIPNVAEEKLKDLDEDGIIRIGAEVASNDILVGKISPKGKKDLTAEERLLQAIFGEKAREVKDTSLTMSHGEEGRVIAVKVFAREDGYSLEPGVIKEVEVKVAQLRKLAVGDKMANRHGNKGVISKILPAEDMPFMEDGTPIDIVFNPTGIGKRMNIGQVFETHLGFAAQKLGYLALCPPFAGPKAEEIKQILKNAGLPEDGKVKLYDGYTGESFAQKVTVGYMYVMKLGHMAEDKIHMRSIGPYSLITQQPLGGKAQFGGQRFGEMEVWALEGYGAAYALQEMLTIKADDVSGRAATYRAILKGEKIKPPTVPASFNLLVNELKALGLNVELRKWQNEKNNE